MSGLTDCDEKTPPHSIYFSDSHRIKSIPKTTVTEVPAISYPPPYPAHAAPPYPPYPYLYPYPYTLPPLPPPGQPTQPLNNVSNSPKKLSLPRPYDLKSFCQDYGISDRDCERLAKLEFVPGNRNILSLTDADWGSVGFTKLCWLYEALLGVLH